MLVDDTHNVHGHTTDGSHIDQHINCNSDQHETTTTTTIIPLPPAANVKVPAVPASFKVLTMLLVHQATYIHNINPPHQKVQRAVLANHIVGANQPNLPPSHSHSHAHTHIHTHYLHLHTFTCAQLHSLMFLCIQFQSSVVWPGCLIMTAISLAPH